VTGWVNVVCLIGFGASYIVFIKLLIPHVLIVLFYSNSSRLSDPLPTIIGEGQYTGQLFWATLYSIVLLFPLSLARKMKTLIWPTILGIACSIYLTVVVIVIFYTNKDIVPD